MNSSQGPDIVCFLRKNGRNRFIGPGRNYGEKTAKLIRKGYDVVAISRDGDEFVSSSSYLSTIMNLESMENDIYYCSRKQYEARKT